jgi:hypothetical protein
MARRESRHERTARNHANTLRLQQLEHLLGQTGSYPLPGKLLWNLGV